MVLWRSDIEFSIFHYIDYRISPSFRIRPRNFRNRYRFIRRFFTISVFLLKDEFTLNLLIAEFTLNFLIKLHLFVTIFRFLLKLLTYLIRSTGIQWRSGVSASPTRPVAAWWARRVHERRRRRSARVPRSPRPRALQQALSSSQSLRQASAATFLRKAPPQPEYGKKMLKIVNLKKYLWNL